MLKRSFRHIRPHRALRPWIDDIFVESVSTNADHARPYHIRPDDATYLIIRRYVDGASPPRHVTDRMPRIVGPRSVHKPTDLAGRSLTILIRFNPGAVFALFGAVPSDLIDGAYPLEDVSPAVASGISGRLSDSQSAEERVETIQTEIGRRALSASPPDALISAVVHHSRASAGRLSVSDMSRLAGLSSRQLRNRIHDATGLPPKMMARVHRLEYALRLPGIRPDITPAALAFAAGYADQSHLSREFRSLLGVSPAKWLYA